MQNSPALEGVQEAVRASFSDDFLRGGQEEQSSAAMAAASDAHTGSPLWKRLLHVVWREEDSSYIRTQVAQTVSAILHSGLLNEEHHHLVATVMRANSESELDDKERSSGRSSNTPLPSLEDEMEGAPTAGSDREQPMVPSAAPLQCHGTQSSSMDSTRTALLLSSVAVVALLPLWWAPGTFLALTSLLAAAAAIVCVWRCMRRRAVERGVSQVVSYVEGFDSLLCLVAEAIRYLQEMEALSKGYARSSVIGSHFHQVGGAGMGVSHCVVLRRMVHQVVGSLSGGISTRVLSDGTCPAPTIWDGRSHLVREEELGLAELKELCHTLAVGNSRMLRDLCLFLMAFPLEGVQERPSDPLFLLCTLSPSFQRLTLAVERGSRQLKWALRFEETYCSEPQGCMKGLLKAGGCVPSPSPSPLSESLLRGLRGMDLKGQLVVRGVRDCVTLLQADSSQLDSLLQVEAHLLAMQTHLSALSTDLTDALQMLQPGTSTDTERSVGSDHSSDKEGAESPRPRETMSPDRSSLSSDEEKVYEAYVSKRHDSEEECPTGGEDPERPRGQSDLPVKMVNELKNVLSLRELQRMERRAIRRRRRGGADRQTDRQTNGPTGEHHSIQTMQYSSNNSQMPSSRVNSIAGGDNPPVAEETAAGGPASISFPPSSGLPLDSSLREEPVVGVSAPPYLMTASPVGENVPELQAVSSLVALLARQQRSPQKEECFGDSSGSEQDT